MAQKFILKKSSLKNKRYDLIPEDGSKKYSFGHPDYDNFTMHHDLQRKQNYLNRSKTLNDNNELNNNTLARLILWNKPTIQGSIKDVEKKFHIKIINKTNKK